MNNTLFWAHVPGQEFGLVTTEVLWSSSILECCDDQLTSSNLTHYSEPWLLVTVDLPSQQPLLKSTKLSPTP